MLVIHDHNPYSQPTKCPLHITSFPVRTDNRQTVSNNED